MSPRKTRLVVDAIRGLNVAKALEVLKFSGKRAAGPVAKLLNSAIANAEHNNDLEKNNLFIKEIKVDEGPVLKRWRARAFGRASGIKKRTSHITIVLAEIKPSEKQESKKVKKQESKKDVKVVKSLDEVKSGQKSNLPAVNSGDLTKKTKDKKDKSEISETKGPKSTKRRFFSRKAG